MFQLRPFRNADPPALVDLWNQGLPEVGVVRPLNAYEFDALVIGKLGFDPEGLIVAEQDGRIVGYIHAGFGPEQPLGPSCKLDTSLGAIVMMVLRPGLSDAELENKLVRAAEEYLRSKGASVLYAGGQFPLNPFYWGIYGGSEFAGILSAHMSFHRAVTRVGYRPVARSLLLERELNNPPRVDAAILRLSRLVHLEIVEDAVPSSWWEAQAIGLFRPVQYRLRDRKDGTEIAHAWTWDIAGAFDQGLSAQLRTGLIDVEVHAAYRRKGFGRLLVTEIARHARSQEAEVLDVQTADTNTAAVHFYASLGFEPIETTTLYRLPGGVEAARGLAPEPSAASLDDPTAEHDNLTL